MVNFNVYMYAKNQLHRSLLSQDIAKILRTCYFTSFRHGWQRPSNMTVSTCRNLMLVHCLMQFQACSIYILLMLTRFIFNSAASSPFQVCSNSAISLCNTCLSFTHLIQCYFQSSSMFMQLQVPPNSVVSQCFYIYIYIYVLYFSIQV